MMADDQNFSTMFSGNLIDFQQNVWNSYGVYGKRIYINWTLLWISMAENQNCDHLSVKVFHV
jgi:hypothetical protein